MIYFITIHWKTPKWIEIQQKYLKRFVEEEYKIFTSLDMIPDKYGSGFDYVYPEFIKNHGVKLNKLADKVLEEARDEDLIIFLDGDAFPINKIIPYTREKLKKHPMIAVQRVENVGDLIPHPSYCATTVGFWKEIKGDWRKGFKYMNKYGLEYSDIGGNLYKSLLDHKVDWFRMLRSNQTNLHPLFFGIYDNMIYHHGAGFRPTLSSCDLASINEYKVEKRLIDGVKNASNGFDYFIKKVKAVVYFNIIVKIISFRMRSRNRRMSKKVFKSIQDDPDFYRQFQ